MTEDSSGGVDPHGVTEYPEPEVSGTGPTAIPGPGEQGSAGGIGVEIPRPPHVPEEWQEEMAKNVFLAAGLGIAAASAIPAAAGAVAGAAAGAAAAGAAAAFSALVAPPQMMSEDESDSEVRDSQDGDDG